MGKIRSIVSSLLTRDRPGALGTEARLKVEAIAALGNAFQMDKVKNKGIDLIMTSKKD